VEDKLAKAIDELDTLRKFKNDTQRKDELLKDYKERIEKIKAELEAAKTDLEKSRKEKTRL
jgi:predicted phage gp36 major capsid-like protein